MVIYLFLFSFKVDSQDVKLGNCLDEYSNSIEPELKGQVYKGLAGLLGDEFFNPSYLKGDIFLSNGQIAYGQYLRYNGRIDELLLLRPETSHQILLDKYFIQGFCLKKTDSSVQIFFDKISVIKELGADSSQIFAQVLYRNKLSLYAFRRFLNNQHILVRLNSGEEVLQNSYAASFIYYFKLPNGQTIGFKSLKGRDLYKLFPGNKELIKKFFKEKHQRRFNTEEDLIRITKLLNTLY